jgi:predicted Zn-dependent peptidase
METANEVAARIAREYVSFGRIRSIDERLAAYAKVTAEDVQRVAQTYFRDDKRTVVHVVAPPHAKDSK